MIIKLSEYAGFCPGVRKADACIRDLLSNKSPTSRVYTLGHLIHNRIYNEDLERLGVFSINISDVEKVYLSEQDKDMTVVIRTHGIKKEDFNYLLGLEAKYGNLKIADATCPFVKKIHSIAESNTSDDTLFLLFSDPDHPEAIGTMSYAKGEKIAFPRSMK